jgi:preprotein translocase subunit SecE
VARNRKRARDRQGQTPGEESALATARDGETPDPLEHASPDVDLAEAQLALGRPELADVPDEEELIEFEEEEEEADERAAGGAGRSGGRGGGAGSGAGGDGGGLVPAGAPGARAPAHRENLVVRLLHFLQGSWRELQRVQWPDRRQVFQATGVVIGFVIVAGVFLGLSDLVASKLVNLILK